MIFHVTVHSPQLHTCSSHSLKVPPSLFIVSVLPFWHLFVPHNIWIAPLTSAIENSWCLTHVWQPLSTFWFHWLHVFIIVYGWTGFSLKLFWLIFSVFFTHMKHQISVGDVMLQFGERQCYFIQVQPPQAHKQRFNDKKNKEEKLFTAALYTM